MNPTVKITSHLPKRVFKSNYTLETETIETYSISVNDITFLTLNKEEMKELADAIYKTIFVTI